MTAIISCALQFVASTVLISVAFGFFEIQEFCMFSVTVFLVFQEFCMFSVAFFFFLREYDRFSKILHLVHALRAEFASHGFSEILESNFSTASVSGSSHLSPKW